MNGILTPRQMLKGLLQGVPPPRPLFLPIVFSLGAKVENLKLPVFLGNATKITNSLRPIRTHLRSDGVACYFDPYLEAEALGATLQYAADDQRPTLKWPHISQAGELPENLRSPEDAAKSARVTVAVEVIQRLRSLMRDEPLLCAGVSGPFTLAAHLLDLRPTDAPPREDFSDAALEFAAATITQIAIQIGGSRRQRNLHPGKYFPRALLSSTAAPGPNRWRQRSTSSVSTRRSPFCCSAIPFPSPQTRMSCTRAIGIASCAPR